MKKRAAWNSGGTRQTRDEHQRRLPCSGNKRCWPSKREARLAHSKGGMRIRPYYCGHCHGWHVTHMEKNKGAMHDERD